MSNASSFDVSPRAPAVSPETEKLSARFLRQSRVFPLALRDSILTLAMADPLDFETIAAVHSSTGLKVETALAVELPNEKPCDYAVTLKIEGA